MLNVPFIDLATPLARYGAALKSSVEAVIESGAFVLGEAVEAFEREFADYCDVPHAVGCANGTDALELALVAGGVASGDEVITPSMTFAATAEAIVRVGATPVFVDVDAGSLLMDPRQLEVALSPRTAAVVAVHLYGSCVSMTDVAAFARRNDLLLVEDAAQAHGARWQGKRAGSLGDIATFSFYPSKNLGAWGDGGAVVTGDDEIAGRVRLLRDHGKIDKFRHAMVGRNSRLDSIQAAVLSGKLRHLDEENEDRRSAFDYYKNEIERGELSVSIVTPPGEVEPVHHLFVVRARERAKLMEVLTARGIGVGIHYPVPVHRQPAFEGVGRTIDILTETDRACAEVVSLPMHPYLTRGQQDGVIEALSESLR